MALTDYRYVASKPLISLSGGPYAKGEEFSGSVFGTDSLARKYIANSLVDIAKDTDGYENLVLDQIYTTEDVTGDANSNLAGVFTTTPTTLTRSINAALPRGEVGDSVALMIDYWPGIYVVDDIGEDGVRPWVLSRHPDYNTVEKLNRSMNFLIGKAERETILQGYGFEYPQDGWQGIATVSPVFEVGMTEPVSINLDDADKVLAVEINHTTASNIVVGRGNRIHDNDQSFWYQTNGVISVGVNNTFGSLYNYGLIAGIDNVLENPDTGSGGYGSGVLGTSGMAYKDGSLVLGHIHTEDFSGDQIARSQWATWGRSGYTTNGTAQVAISQYDIGTSLAQQFVGTFIVQVVAVSEVESPATPERKAWLIRGSIHGVGSSHTIIGTNTTESWGSPSWAATVVAANEGPRVVVQGEVGKTIRWAWTVSQTEVRL